MARLPIPGADDDNWGEILNEYLLVSHNEDGTVRNNVVTANALAADAVTSAKVQNGAITESKLDTAAQTKLNSGVVVLNENDPDPSSPVNGVLYVRLTSGSTGGGGTDTTAPSVPTNLAQSSVTESSISVSWTASTDNTAVTGYDVRIEGGTPVAVTGTTHTFSSLSASTQYSIDVRARDAAGNTSAYTTAINATTDAPATDVTAPSVPTGLATTSIAQDSIAVSWTASTDNVAVTGYDIRLDGGTPVTVTGTTHTFNSLSGSTQYSIDVRARDAAGNTSAYATAINATTNANGSLLFSDTFNRADGAVGNNWSGPTNWTGTIANNRLDVAGYSSYGRTAQPSSYPKSGLSVRAGFYTSGTTISSFTGVFLGYSATTNTGIRFFVGSGGAWVIGNANSHSTNNTAISGTPSIVAGVNELRLDFDGTNVTAYVNNVQVHTMLASALGFSLDTATTNTYAVGICGAATQSLCDYFEVHAL